MAGSRLDTARTLADATIIVIATVAYLTDLGQYATACGTGETACLWLLDEPFSNLGNLTKQHLQTLLREVADAHDISALIITHSIEEAIFLGDRIVVFSASPGRVIDVFDPEMTHPRERLMPEFTAAMERVKHGIVSVL